MAASVLRHSRSWRFKWKFRSVFHSKATYDSVDDTSGPFLSRFSCDSGFLDGDTGRCRELPDIHDAALESANWDPDYGTRRSERVEEDRELQEGPREW